MTVIKSGAGVEYSMEVDSDLRAHVRAVSVREEEDISVRKGDVYTATTGNTPISAAAGVIFYLKNTSATKLLLIEDLSISFATAGAHISLQLGDTGTPGTTTTITPVNLNTFSSNAAPCDCFVTSGAAISGLTDGNIMFGLGDLVGDELLDVPVSGSVVLGQNNVFTVDVDVDAAGGATTGDTTFTCRFRFEEKALFGLQA